MSTTVWDPEVLARIRHLELRARQAALGFLHGGHRSIRTAANVEFSDYKEYTPGDNLRDLDWKVLGRSDRLVVRRHQAETELPVAIVLDASADLGTGRRGVVRRPPLEGSKFGYAVTVAATVAYFAHLRRDPVGLFTVGGQHAPFPAIPPRGGQGHLAQLFAQLASVSPSSRAGLGEALSTLAGRLTRRTVVVVISDLMEEPATFAGGFAHLARNRADLRVIHLHDRREWELDYKDAARFYSPEGGAELPVDPAGVRDAFAGVVREYVAEVKAILAPHRAWLLATPTDTPLETVLTRLARAA